MRYKKRYFLALAFNQHNYEELKKQIDNKFEFFNRLLKIKSGFLMIDDLSRNSNNGLLFVFKCYNNYKNEVLFIISQVKGVVTLLSSGNIKKIKQRINYGIDRRHNGV